MFISVNYKIVNGFLGKILDDLKTEHVDLGFIKDEEEDVWDFYVQNYEAMQKFESRKGVTNWDGLTVEQQRKIHAVIKNNMPKRFDRDEYACAVDLLLCAMGTPGAVRPSTKMGANDDPDDYGDKRGKTLDDTLSDLNTTIDGKKQRLAQEEEKANREKAFVENVKNGNWADVKDQLSEHPELATLKFEYQYGEPDRKRGNNTVLHVAAFAGNKETVDQILATEQGKTTLNMKNSYGSTPLHIASYVGKGDIVSTLVGNGASINEGDNNKNTPLHIATFNGKKEVVETLLANKADVNLADKNGNTSLHVGVATGKKEIAETLMAHNGVDLTLKNKKNMTAHDLVIEQGQKVQTALQNNEGDANAHQAELKKLSELHQAFSKKDGTLSRYSKARVRSYTDASKDLDAETTRVSEEAKKYEATLATYYDDAKKKTPLRLRIEALRNKDNTSGKMTPEMRNKAKANLKKIYEAQGYPTDRAELQAQIMLGKLVRANLLYHPDERVKIDGKKSQTVTGLLIPQDNKYKGMTHRTILHDLATTEVADTEKYIAPLNNIEDAVSFSGYALKKPKDKGTNRRMSYNPKKGITAGYRTEETLVDTTNKTEAKGLMARLSSVQQPEAPKNPAQKLRQYDEKYQKRADFYQSYWNQLAGKDSKVKAFKGKETTEKKELATALENIEKILEANGYTDEEHRKRNAKIILSKMERASLESRGKPFGFDHNALLLELTSGAISPDKYASIFTNISTLEERVSLVHRYAISSKGDAKRAGFKEIEPSNHTLEASSKGKVEEGENKQGPQKQGNEK